MKITRVYYCIIYKRAFQKMAVVSNNPPWRGQVGSCVENPGAKCRYLLSTLSQLPLLRASRGHLNSEQGKILILLFSCYV